MAPVKSQYQVIEVTDLRTKKKTYKIIVRNSVLPSVVTGLATREEAETKMRELDEAAQ